MSGFFYIPTFGLFYCTDIFSEKLYLFSGKMYICNVLFRIDFRLSEIADEKGIG